MPDDIPAWVLDGWYGNNPDKQRLAIIQYRMPVVSPGEVAQNKHYLATGEVLPLAHFIAQEANETPAPTAKAADVDQLRARIKPSGPWFTVPAMTSVSECRSCRASGFWIRTESGAKMLVDCDVHGGKRPNRAEDGTGVAHFATCPTGYLWRKT